MEGQLVLGFVLVIRSRDIDDNLDLISLRLTYRIHRNGLERITLDDLHIRYRKLCYRWVIRHFDDVVVVLRTEIESLVRELFLVLIRQDNIIQRSDFRFHAFEGNEIRVIRHILRPNIDDNGIAHLILFGFLIVVPRNRCYVRNRQAEVQFHLIAVTLGIEVLQRNLIDIDHLQRSIRRELYRIVNRIGARCIVLCTYGKHMFEAQRLAFIRIRHIRGVNQLMVFAFEPLHNRCTTGQFGNLFRSKGIIILLLRALESG